MGRRTRDEQVHAGRHVWMKLTGGVGLWLSAAGCMMPLPFTPFGPEVHTSAVTAPLIIPASNPADRMAEYQQNCVVRTGDWLTGYRYSSRAYAPPEDVHVSYDYHGLWAAYPESERESQSVDDWVGAGIGSFLVGDLMLLATLEAQKRGWLDTRDEVALYPTSTAIMLVAPAVFAVFENRHERRLDAAYNAGLRRTLGIAAAVPCEPSPPGK